MKYSVILFVMVIISNSFAVNEPKSPVPTEQKFVRSKSKELAIIGAAVKNPEYAIYYEWPSGNSPVETYLLKDLPKNTRPFSNTEQPNSQNNDKTYYP